MQTRYVTQLYFSALVTALLILVTVSSDAQTFQQTSITLPPVTYPNGQLSAIAKMTVDGNDNIYYSYNVPQYSLPGGLGESGQSGIQKIPFSNGSYSTPVDIAILSPTVIPIPTRDETTTESILDINSSLIGGLVENIQTTCAYTNPQIALDCNSVPSGGLINGLNETWIPDPNPDAYNPYVGSNLPNPANSSGKPVAVAENYAGSPIWGVFNDSSIHAFEVSSDPDYPSENFSELGSGTGIENANPDSIAVDPVSTAYLHFPGNSYISKFVINFGPVTVSHTGDINIAGLGTNVGGMATDINSNLYVGDPSNSRVLMVPASDQSNPVTIATINSNQFSIIGVDNNGNIFCWDQAASAANGSLTIIKLTPSQ